MQSNQYNWLQLIEEQKNSNLTITEFCKQKKLNKSSFYRWTQKLSSTACKENTQKNAKIEYWRSLIKEQKASDLGITKFCKQKQVSHTTFSRWKNKLDVSPKNTYATKNEKVGWLEAIVPDKHHVSENTEIRVKFGEFTVMIPNHFEESTFLRVCRMLVDL